MSVGMRKTMIFLMLFRPGLCRLSSCLTYEYHFANMNKNWTEAQSYCREKYTDLVTIDNPEEMNRVINRVNLTGYTGPAWIGLEKGNSWKWQWSLEERRLYSDGQTEFSNWDSGEPNNSGGNENCVGMRDTGKWNDIPCDSKTPTGFFVCYNERKQTNQKYIIINKKNSNWTEAQRYCRENHTDLVSVRNQTENDLIHNMSKSGTWMWIGLYKDYWQWSDQRNSSFRYWAPGKPDNFDGNEKCTVASITPMHSGTWNDRQCGEKHPFLCYDEKPPPYEGKRTVVKVKLGSAANLKDPDFSDQILQQLRKELIGRVMSEDTQLRWRIQPDGQIFHLSEEDSTGHEGKRNIT